MKIFLSSLEQAVSTHKNAQGQSEALADFLIKNGIPLRWNLMSYYYIRNKPLLAERIRDNSDEIIIDSGAHSFQFGKKVDFEKYTYEYAEFIKRFDRKNVLGYFEMDIDNVIGYENVLKLRKIIESVTDKCIPVWHYNRGIDEYIKMCKEYAGKIVAITGFKNKDIKDEQYIMFLKEAKKYGCKVHCLGMTRKKVLDKVPFDFVDSSSWVQNGIFGRLADAGRVSKQMSRDRREIVFSQNYVYWTKVQEEYYQKWRKICKD